MMVSVPNKPKTTLRNVRIDDELWSAAQERAAANGTNVSEVIRTQLKQYVRRGRRDDPFAPHSD